MHPHLFRYKALNKGTQLKWGLMVNDTIFYSTMNDVMICSTNVLSGEVNWAYRYDINGHQVPRMQQNGRYLWVYNEAGQILKLDAGNGDIVMSRRISSFQIYSITFLAQNGICIAGKDVASAMIQLIKFDAAFTVTQSYKYDTNAQSADIQILQTPKNELIVILRESQVRYTLVQHKADPQKINIISQTLDLESTMRSRLLESSNPISSDRYQVYPYTQLQVYDSHIYLGQSYPSQSGYLIGKFDVSDISIERWVRSYNLESQNIPSQVQYVRCKGKVYVFYIGESMLYVTVVNDENGHVMWVKQFGTRQHHFIMGMYTHENSANFYVLSTISQGSQLLSIPEATLSDTGVGTTTTKIVDFIQTTPTKSYPMTSTSQNLTQTPSQTPMIIITNHHKLPAHKISISSSEISHKEVELIVHHGQSLHHTFMPLFCPVDPMTTYQLTGTLPPWLVYDALTRVMQGTVSNPSYTQNITINLKYTESLGLTIRSRMVKITVVHQTKPIRFDNTSQSIQRQLQVDFSLADRYEDEAKWVGFTIVCLALLIQLLQVISQTLSPSPKSQNSLFFLNTFQLLLTSLHFNVQPIMREFIKGFLIINFKFEFIEEIWDVKRWQSKLMNAIGHDQQNPIFTRMYEVDSSSTLVFYSKFISLLIVSALILGFIGSIYLASKHDFKFNISKKTYCGLVWNKIGELFYFDMFLCVIENSFWFMVCLGVTELTWYRWKDQKISYTVTAVLLYLFAIYFIIILPYQTWRHHRLIPDPDLSDDPATPTKPTKRYFFSALFNPLKPNLASYLAIWGYFYLRRVLIIVVSQFLHRKRVPMVILYYGIQALALVYVIAVRPMAKKRDNFILIISEISFFAFVHTIIVFENSSSKDVNNILDRVFFYYFQVIMLINLVIILLTDLFDLVKAVYQSQNPSQDTKIQSRAKVYAKPSPNTQEITEDQPSQHPPNPRHETNEDEVNQSNQMLKTESSIKSNLTIVQDTKPTKPHPALFFDTYHCEHSDFNRKTVYDFNKNIF